MLCWLIAGCGGGSQSQTTANFKASYLSLTGAIQQIGAEMTRAIEHASHRTPSQIASEFSDLADRFNTQLIQLEALNPPSSVAGAFQKLTAAASRLEDDLNAISNAGSRKDGVAAVTAIRAVVRDADAMNASGALVFQKLQTK